MGAMTVDCVENRFLADWFTRKIVECEDKPNMVQLLKKAQRNVCTHRTPITNLHEAKQVSGIGTWLLRQLKAEFFVESNAVDQSPNVVAQKPTGRKEKVKKRYLPTKNSAAYAILITLLRARRAGKPFMMKKELIDATEGSGLSRKPIMPARIPLYNGQGQSREFYSGWNGMTTLIHKGLVIKKSSPAKYQLTDEGEITAQECLEKSGMVEESRPGACSESEEDRIAATAAIEDSDSEADMEEDVTSYQGQDGLMSQSSQTSTICSQILGQPITSRKDTLVRVTANHSAPNRISELPPRASISTFEPTSIDELAVPPLKVGEKFPDAYDIVCILDTREQFRRDPSGSNLQKFKGNLATQFEINVETRQVPVGDALWVARHKHTKVEYVLDFVVERKQVDDLWKSIRDNRYKQQKLRLMNCGLKRLMYMVEGDVNMVETSGSIKTAMFTTELAEGFHVLRTSGVNDTLKHYGNLTIAIKNRYQVEVGKQEGCSGQVCKTFKDFLEHCKDLEKDRVTDIFCLQLMQISQITENIALSIRDKYPTLLSLISAYIKLEGNVDDQEKLLQKLPIRGTGKTISATISKSVYKLVWAP